MAKVYYVGDWAIMLGPVFAETPFNHAVKGTEVVNYGSWLKDALEATGEHEVRSVPTWDFYQLPPGEIRLPIGGRTSSSGTSTRCCGKTPYGGCYSHKPDGSSHERALGSAYMSRTSFDRLEAAEGEFDDSSNRCQTST